MLNYCLKEVVSSFGQVVHYIIITKLPNSVFSSQREPGTHREIRPRIEVLACQKQAQSSH
jgi:hypothetical protein